VGKVSDFTDYVQKSLKETRARRPRQKKIVTRPELLLHPNIPAPLHGLAPRTIMGSKWWEATREAAYRKAHYCCLACGVHKSKAKFRQWLEAHETYQIDWHKGRSEYIETVALCHCCHNYIHSGRLEALLEEGRISHAKFAAIHRHGDEILAKAGLAKKVTLVSNEAPWGKWRLVFNGKLYKPKYKTKKAWERAYGND